MVRRFRVGPETRVCDVKRRLVGRKGQAVRPMKIVDDDLQAAVARIKAVDIATADIALRPAALVFGADAVSWIGKPDGAVGFDDDIVGRVETLALILVGYDRY